MDIETLDRMIPIVGIGYLLTLVPLLIGWLFGTLMQRKSLKTLGPVILFGLTALISFAAWRQAGPGSTQGGSGAALGGAMVLLFTGVSAVVLWGMFVGSLLGLMRNQGRSAVIRFVMGLAFMGAIPIVIIAFFAAAELSN